MTVSAGTTKTTQNCNGSLTDFSFNFAIYGEDDIAVILRNTSTEAEHLLVLNTDYTVASDDFANGGTVSTIQEVDEEIVPWTIPSGYTITIMLNLALIQETDFLYGGNFSSEAYELTVDRLTRIAQQLSETINRTLKLRKTSAQENIEIDDLEAGKFVMVNAAGDALEMGEAGGSGGASISNDPYDKDTWDNVAAIAASKNAIRDELFNNRFTKGATYSMILGLGTGSFLGLPVSNEAYGATWDNMTKIAPSQNAVYDKIEAMGGGAGDVVGPATNTDNYVPQWIGADSKTLKNGFPITAKGKALVNNNSAAGMRTTLELGTAALRAADDTLEDNSNLPDGHAIKTYGDANWGGAVSGPASAVDNGIPTFDGTTGKILQDTTRLIEDTLTDGANLPDGHAIKTYGDTNWGGYTDLTEFITQTAWRLFYSNTDGDVTELVLGTVGQYLKSGGAAVAPSWDTPAGAGDVVGPAANTDNYVPQWNGADSKTLKNGFIITAAGKSLLDDVTVAAMRTTLGLDSAALRAAEDTLTDGANLPDGHAIKTYGDTNWGGAGAGDVLGPAAHAASYVPQWNTTPNSKTLVAGFMITQVGKNFLDDATTAAQRSTLGLGSAALRTAEDTLTDGANLPDGHAIKIYGDANWGGAGGNQWEYHTGYQAGHNLTTGTKNCLGGYRTGYDLTTAVENSFWGYHAGYHTSVGGSTAHGARGTGNTYMGESAGYSNDRGSFNTFMGWHAGHDMAYNAYEADRDEFRGYGDFSTIIGANAGYYTFGGFNTFVGMGSGHKQKAGYDNVYMGLWAGHFVEHLAGSGGYVAAHGNANTSIGNVFIGANAGMYWNIGIRNTCIGYLAGYGTHGGGSYAPTAPMPTGSDNTFLGASAGQCILNGNLNVGIGFQSLLLLTNGLDNVAVGNHSGYAMTTGSYNTFLGRYSGKNCTTGQSNVAIGSGAGDGITTLSNACCIGSYSNVTISNALVLGGAGCKVGIIKTNPTCALDITGQIRTTGNISSGYNTSVPTNRSVLLDGEYGNTGFYYDGSCIRLVKAGVVVDTW